MARFIDNSGQTPEEAIVILDAEDPMDGVTAEYAYLEQRYGPRHVHWQLHSQELQEIEGRFYDILTIETGPGDLTDVYFDISAFFGQD